MTIDTSKLPYQDKPATPLDVAEELVKLSALVSAIVSVSKREGASYELSASMLADGTQEPGTSVVLQKARFALALESLISDNIEFIGKITIEAVENMLVGTVNQLEEEGYLHRHEEEE